MRPPDTALIQRAEDVIENEFAAYYLADELPPLGGEVFRQHLPAHASASAQRLGWGVPDLVPALVAVLERVAADPRAPLVARLSEASVLEWTDEDAWPIFQEIVTQIAQSLQPPGA